MKNKTASSVGVDLFRQNVDVRKLYAIEKVLKDARDEQSLKLLNDIQIHFMDKFDMKSGEEHAWNRLRNMVQDGGRWSPDLIRNNVFKVANSLGMHLPSGMFASAPRMAGEQYKGQKLASLALDRAWGPIIGR